MAVLCTGARRRRGRQREVQYGRFSCKVRCMEGQSTARWTYGKGCTRLECGRGAHVSSVVGVHGWGLCIREVLWQSSAQLSVRELAEVEAGRGRLCTGTRRGGGLRREAWYGSSQRRRLAGGALYGRLQRRWKAEGGSVRGLAGEMVGGGRLGTGARGGGGWRSEARCGGSQRRWLAEGGSVRELAAAVAGGGRLGTGASHAKCDAWRGSPQHGGRMGRDAHVSSVVGVHTSRGW